ncbi:hypothetical protein [Aliiroseovarius sp. 2305UL8-7]|uniref:hypothetical protein n=1 Tax=Aliiroseovarius conchicola TaxID=3121637 RepID=UPI0035276B6A
MSNGVQKQSFEDRLAKIGAERASQSTKRKKASVWSNNLAYPATVLGAFLLGLTAVFVSRYIRFHIGMGGLAGDDADMMMLVDGGMGVAVGIALKQLFHMEGKEFQSAQAVGVFAMICVMHNFVHWAPTLFDRIFSPQWTAMVITSTDPNSILLAGTSFVLDTETEHRGAADASSTGWNEPDGGSGEATTQVRTRVNQLPQVQQP